MRPRDQGGFPTTRDIGAGLAREACPNWRAAAVTPLPLLVRCREESRHEGVGVPLAAQCREDATPVPPDVRQVDCSLVDIGEECPVPGQDGAHRGVGEIAESGKDEVRLPVAPDEVGGPAPYLLVGVAEPGRRPASTASARTFAGQAAEEVHCLAPYERLSGAGEAEEPDGDRPGAVGAYGLEECDAGGQRSRRPPLRPATSRAGAGVALPC
ncbi:hypothetical protein ACFYNW_06555 [Streptomyces virginiae]|uniref:hypothetical protein n=1 Tax=Streptomyces virginiae TaxID=1961 RepID=UPI0033BAB558